MLPPPHHNTYLNAHIRHLLDIVRDALNRFKILAVAFVSHQGFARDFDEHAAVLGGSFWLSEWLCGHTCS
jgi:hypothetical protein